MLTINVEEETMKNFLCGVLFTLVFASAVNMSAAEGQQMTPDQEQQMLQQNMNLMIPVLGQMMKAMMQAQLDILSDPKTAEALAIYTKSYYDALIKKGFTKEESLSIVMHMGIPSFPKLRSE